MLKRLSSILFFLILAGCAANNGVSNGGATGAAPERYIGIRSNVNGTWSGATSSTTMLQQRIKQDSARGATTAGADTRY